MKVTIISKKPLPFIYQEWEFKNGQYFPKGEGIFIHGGAGVVGGIDRDSGRPHKERGIAIPEGVATILDESVYERLAKIKKFQHDVKRGVMKVIKGAISDQSKIDSETHDMLENEHIPNRPYSQEDIEAAGGVVNKDGSINIGEAEESIDNVRRHNAGQMAYVKKREAEKRKADRVERRRSRKA